MGFTRPPRPISKTLAAVLSFVLSLSSLEPTFATLTHLPASTSSFGAFPSGPTAIRRYAALDETAGSGWKTEFQHLSARLPWLDSLPLPALVEELGISLPQFRDLPLEERITQVDRTRRTLRERMESVTAAYLNHLAHREEFVQEQLETIGADLDYLRRIYGPFLTAPWREQLEVICKELGETTRLRGREREEAVNASMRRLAKALGISAPGEVTPVAAGPQKTPGAVSLKTPHRPRDVGQDPEKLAPPSPADAAFASNGETTARVESGSLMQYFATSWLRGMAWFVTHAIYRIHVIGEENVPRRGPAILAPNHVSFVDALLVGASTRRQIRFIMEKTYFDASRLGRWFFNLMKVIPLARGNAKQIREALNQAAHELQDGHVVAIFPEGRITKLGQPLKFKPGVEKLAQRTQTPIVPVHLDGVWGSVFSFLGGGFLSHWPRKVPYPVTVSFAPPLPPTASAHEVRQRVMDLGAEAFRRRLEGRPTLARLFLRQVKKNWFSWFRMAVADSTGRKFSYGKTLIASLLLAGILEKTIPANQNVGILLPPTAAAALSNLALATLGKVPVNLNYTATPETLEASIQKAQIGAVLTARPLLKRFDLPETDRMVFIEDLVAQMGRQKLRAILLGATLFALPRILVEALFFDRASRSLEDTATILFTTGSTGVPKGVVLSHRNLLANIESVREVLPLDTKDRVLGSLPLFHAFGLTATLWLPLLSGFAAVYHTSPLDFEKIGELVHEYKATMLLTLPSFLPKYLKAVSPAHFASLKRVIVGAEKMDPAAAQEFETRYGAPVLEGYGATELSPVAALNIPDAGEGKGRQAGRKLGSVGRPIPGVTVRIVDPEHPDPNRSIPPGTEGLFLVKGPNVMQGYLSDPDKTNEVLKDGWYDTKDIARMDEDGFLYITDRSDRIAKIKGEKVPLSYLELELHQAARRQDRTFVVVSVKDATQADRLIVLYQNYTEPLQELLRKLRAKGLRNFMIPETGDFLLVDSIPLIGIGKPDYRKAKALAEQWLKERATR